MYDKLANAMRLGTSPIVRALVDFDGGMDMVRALDGISFATWFTQFGGSRGSLTRMWDPIAYALGGGLHLYAHVTLPSHMSHSPHTPPRATLPITPPHATLPITLPITLPLHTPMYPKYLSIIPTPIIVCLV